MPFYINSSLYLPVGYACHPKTPFVQLTSWVGVAEHCLHAPAADAKRIGRGLDKLPIVSNGALHLVHDLDVVLQTGVQQDATS